MNDTDVRHVFDRALADEPAMSLTADGVTGAVTRERRKRVVRRSVLASVGAVVAAVAIAVPLVNNKPKPVVNVNAAAQVVTTIPVASADTGVNQTVLDAIRSVTPTGWSFDLHSNNAFDTGVDGHVDDGTGLSRLLVAVTTHKHWQIVHPCSDSEFRSNVSCDESTLEDGSILAIRGLVDYKGVKTLVVTISHQDGTGVFIESGNFKLPDERKPLTAEDKGRLVPVTRDMPAYNTDQLIAMAKAVDAATRQP